MRALLLGGLLALSLSACGGSPEPLNRPCPKELTVYADAHLEARGY